MVKNLSFPARITKFFIENSALSSLIIVASFAFAVFAYVDSPKNNNPEVDVAAFSIVVQYPGASSAEVDQFVARDLSLALSKFSRIEKLTTQSSSGQALVVVQFEAKQNVDDIKTKVMTEAQLLNTRLTSWTYYGRNPRWPTTSAQN